MRQKVKISVLRAPHFTVKMLVKMRPLLGLHILTGERFYQLMIKKKKKERERQLIIALTERYSMVKDYVYDCYVKEPLR